MSTGALDRISTQIDPAFGTEDEFPLPWCREPTGTAETIIDDIVPGHTGKGADFRLVKPSLHVTKPCSKRRPVPVKLPACLGLAQ